MARTTVPLNPGETTIDRVQAVPFRGKWAIFWRICFPDGTAKDQRTQGNTKGEARRRAKLKAQELFDNFKQAHSQSAWKMTDSLADYMDAVTLPAISSSRLSESTRRRYNLSYRLLLNRCNDKDCHHEYSLAPLSISDFQTKRLVKDCLEEIARLHGVKNVKHCKIVLSKYVVSQLDTDDLLRRDPTYKLDLDLSQAKMPAIQRGGQALTLDEYQRAVDYLLAQDPNEAPEPKRGRWTHEQRISERATLLDLVLTQAATGMRTSEVATATGDTVSIEPDGTVVFHLAAERVKTRKGRPVPVMLPEVSERLTARLKALPAPNAPLFPAPADPTSQWETRNRNRKLEAIYRELARELDIEMFTTERGHSWRTTLNSLLADDLPEDVRIRVLGHTAEVNRHHYTAVSSTEAVVAKASKALRATTGSKVRGKVSKHDSE